MRDNGTERSRGKAFKWILGRTLKGCGIIVILFLVFLVVVVAPRINTKAAAHHADTVAHKTAQIDDLRPEMQFENHTCGLHSLEVIYKAYGLDPEQENLRFRLGVDVPANPLDQESTGSVHADIYRVLEQDGFLFTSVLSTDEGAAIEALRSHLHQRHPAILLILMKGSGGLHWVVCTELEGERLLVLDSLAPNPYKVDVTSFFETRVLSCILVEPSNEEPPLKEYGIFYGVNDMKDALQRYNTLLHQQSQ